MAIEYLCDDLGAQVHGVHVSINGLLKLGADSEMQAAIQQQELLSRRHGNLNARDVIEAIEAAIPYGHTSKETLERAVEESLKRRSQSRRNLSLKGFLEYAWQGDAAASHVTSSPSSCEGSSRFLSSAAMRTRWLKDGEGGPFIYFSPISITIHLPLPSSSLSIYLSPTHPLHINLSSATL